MYLLQPEIARLEVTPGDEGEECPHHETSAGDHEPGDHLVDRLRIRTVFGHVGLDREKRSEDDDAEDEHDDLEVLFHRASWLRVKKGERPSCLFFHHHLFYLLLYITICLYVNSCIYGLK